MHSKPLPLTEKIMQVHENSEVYQPKHYRFFQDLEAIEVIAGALTEEEFYGYCLGNKLKYRLRAGSKGDIKQDLDKSNFYEDLFELHKHRCK